MEEKEASGTDVTGHSGSDNTSVMVGNVSLPSLSSSVSRSLNSRSRRVGQLSAALSVSVYDGPQTHHHKQNTTRRSTHTQTLICFSTAVQIYICCEE